MSGDSTLTVSVRPDTDSMAAVLDAALAALRRADGEAGVPAGAAALIVTREGMPVEDVRWLPARAFVLLTWRGGGGGDGRCGRSGSGSTRLALKSPQAPTASSTESPERPSIGSTRHCRLVPERPIVRALVIMSPPTCRKIFVFSQIFAKFSKILSPALPVAP